MDRQDLTGQRAIAIFLLAAVAFSPLFVSVFSGSGVTLGIPTLFLYIFGAWGLVVLAIGVNVFRSESGEREGQSPPAQGGPEQLEAYGDLDALAGSDIFPRRDRRF